MRFKKNDPKTIRAWTFYDWANSVYNLIISTAIFPMYYSAMTLKDGTENVTFFGRTFINTEILGYVYSFSFLLVVLMVPILSGIADYSGTKKRFMQVFCYIGSIGCISLYWFDPANLELSFISVFLGSIGFWGSLVFYNSFLLEIADKEQHDSISARGFSMGYIGSVSLLVSILVLNGMGLMEIRTGFLLVGIWWAGFAQYTYYYLPNKSYYPKKDERAKGHNIIKSGYSELLGVWKELKQTSVVKWFLSSYFIYNMGVQTVMLMAINFAIKEIKWIEDSPNWWETKQTGLIASIIIIQLIAIAGAYFMSGRAKKWGNFRTLMFATMIWVVCTIVAYFIHLPTQFYMLAVLVGFVMGGIQSLSRSTYSKLVPKTDDSASYFSFFDIMEKIGLIIGPFLFAFIEGITGSMRQSVLMLMVLFIGGFFLLLKTQSVHTKSEKASA